MADRIDPVVSPSVQIEPAFATDAAPLPQESHKELQPTASDTLLTAARAEELLSGFKEAPTPTPAVDPYAYTEPEYLKPDENGHIVILGTENRDDIFLTIEKVYPGTPRETRVPGDYHVVLVNGTKNYVKEEDINKVRVIAGDGNDWINTRAWTADILIDGGWGSNTVERSRNNNLTIVSTTGGGTTVGGEASLDGKDVYRDLWNPEALPQETSADAIAANPAVDPYAYTEPEYLKPDENGHIVILGTENRDDIFFTIEKVYPGTPRETRVPGDYHVVFVNGTKNYVKEEDINKVRVIAGDGNDWINTRAWTADILIDGGWGSNTVERGRNNNITFVETIGGVTAQWGEAAQAENVNKIRRQLWKPV